MSWEKIALGDLVTITKGRKHSETDDESGFRYLQIEDLNGASTKKYTKETGTHVSEKDIIIAWDGANAGKVGCGLSGVIGSTLARLTFKKLELETRFVKRFLDYKFEFIKSKRTGATIPHVSGEALKRLLIPLPSFKTQQSIASILDKGDDLRRKDRELLAKYNELLQSIFYQMFGDPVKNDKHFPKKCLGELCKDFSYGTNTKSDNAQIQGSIPIIRIPNVLNNKVNYEDLKFSVITEQELAKVKLQKGDLLFVRTNGNPAYIGRCAVFNDEFLCGYASYLIRARIQNTDIILPEFVQFVIAFNTYRKLVLQRATTTAGNYNINTMSLKSLQIITPPIKNQYKFLEILHAVEKQRNISNQQLIQSEALFQSVLQKAFRGQMED